MIFSFRNDFLPKIVMSRIPGSLFSKFANMAKFLIKF